METLDAITGRRSVPRTIGPALARDEVERLLDAAVRAPTHHLTQPWRFIVLAGAGLDALGGVVAESARDAGLGAMIRTGVHAISVPVREHLGIKPDEHIAGFVHVGRIPDDTPRRVSPRTPASEVTEWRVMDVA